MLKTTNGPTLLNPKVVKIVVIILFILFCYRMCVIAPQFFPWLLVCCLGAVILFYVTRSLNRFIFPACPQCGDIMDIFVRWPVFTGAVNVDGGISFSPIVIEKSHCPKCNNVHMRLRYQNSVRGDARDFFISKVTREFGAEYQGSNLKIDEKLTDKYGNKALTNAQYQNMIKELKDMVVKNNRKAGFEDNPKDIELK